MGQRIAAGKLVLLVAKPDFWLAALLLWTLISAARSLGTPWAASALTEAVRWSGGIGLALAWGWHGRRVDAGGQFLVTLAGALAVMGMLGSGNPPHGGLTGPYHDHQLYGSVLLLLIPFCASLALTASQAAWRGGALAALAAGILCLFLSETRSAWLGLAAAGVVFGGFWLSHSPLRTRRWRVALIPALLLLSGLLAAWVLAGPADQRLALSRRASTFTALSQDESWQSRLTLWHGTARLIEASPAFGIGLGHFSGTLSSPAGSTPAPLERPSLSTEAHCFYLQTAAELGLVGLGLYGCVLAAFVRLALVRLGGSRRLLREQDGLLIAALSALAGQGIDALASPSWQFPEVSFFFWAVLGLGLASLRPQEEQNTAPALPRPLRRFGQWALSGSLAVVLAAQILPLGLLTPVEAYTHSSAVTFQSLTISQVACTSGAGPCFTIKALYSDGGLQDVTFDGGSGSGIVSSFRCVIPPGNVTPCHSTFGSGSTRNQLNLSGNDAGKTVKITGSFEDDSVSPAGKATYTAETSPVYSLQL